MSNRKERTSTGGTSTNNHHHVLSSEARLSRLHRLFKNQYNVTEPSLIVEPYLFLGNCISAHDTHRLETLGIRYILNVAIRDVELCPYYKDDIRVHTIDLRDDDRENILRTFEQAFYFIDEAKRTKARVLVHCSHGQSRSPAIVIAYLMRTYDVSLEQCLIHVIKARPCVSPNDGFLKQLILFDRFLVDRRRRREEAAAKKVTEIPVHHQTANGDEIHEKEKRTSNDASEKQQSNSAVVKSYGSSNPKSSSTRPKSMIDDSVHIIPIQAAVKKSRSYKNDHLSSRKSSEMSNRYMDENNPTFNLLKEKIKIKHKSTLDVSLPESKNEANQQSTEYTTAGGGRSKSARPERSRQSHDTFSLNHSFHVPTDIPYFYEDYQSPTARPTKTKYITEIYDRATNRFIRAQS